MVPASADGSPSDCARGTPIIAYQPQAAVDLRVGRWDGESFLSAPGNVVGVRLFIVSRREFAAASSFAAAPWQRLRDPVLDTRIGLWVAAWNTASHPEACGYVIRVDMDYLQRSGAVETETGLTFAVPAHTLCYADCNGDGALTIDDFICFMDNFAAAQQLPTTQQIIHYANCTGATEPPILTLDDFICFMDEFAAGCP